jgi:hypothetical protein
MLIYVVVGGLLYTTPLYSPLIVLSVKLFFFFFDSII